MGRIGKAYREWMETQTIEGYTVAATDDTHVGIEGPLAQATVGYHYFEGSPEVVEMSATERASGKSLFFLHFELTDIERAKELFGELREVLVGVGARGERRVLLCCTAGMTTYLFATRLQEAADALSLGYTFEARPLEEAKHATGDFCAVMLAPQVGHRRREVTEAFPNAVVFEIPPKVFGAFDAGGALRMLMGLVGDETFAARDARDLSLVRGMENDRRVLIITVVMHPCSTTIAWRLFDRYRLVDADRVHKWRMDYQDIVDILRTLHLRGIELSSIDAVGIALPGAVDFGHVTNNGRHLVQGGRDNVVTDVEQMIFEQVGVRAFIDNNANAAAVGCYVQQDDYDSIVLHTQQVGYLVGGQGVVANGHLLRGRRGATGELGSLYRRLFLQGGLHMGDYAGDGRDLDVGSRGMDVTWEAERMLPLLATTLVADIALIAPDAIFVAYDLIDDMDLLRTEIAKSVDEDRIPDLIHVDDYRERIFTGEMALVLQRLSAQAT